MMKIEIIWHYLLWEAVEKKQFRQTQQFLAEHFGYSLSTVNLAVRKVAAVGAVEVSGKFLVVKDVKKLLYFWATHRNFNGEIIYQTFVDEPVLEIEGLIPAEAILAGYTAAREILGEAPADYSKVYFYFDEDKLEVVKKRFPQVGRAEPNLFVIKKHSDQLSYGSITTMSQTFVDLWNLSDWYAKDFLLALERKIDELLS